MKAIVLFFFLAISVQCFSQSARRHISNGLEHFQSGQYELALEQFNRAIWHQPRYVEPYCLKGNALYKLSHYDEAIQAYTIAIERDSLFREAYYGRHLSWKALGNDSASFADSSNAGTPLTLRVKLLAAYAGSLAGQKSVFLSDTVLYSDS